MLASSVRELSVKHARILFKSCVLPVLTYGSILRYRGTGQTTLINTLARTQNVRLRWITSTFKTSPIAAMEHVASIPPIQVTLQRFRSNAATRLRRLPVQSEVARRLPRHWDTHDPSVPQPANTKSTQRRIIHRLASQSHPGAEFTIPYLSAPWEQPHPSGERLQSSFPAPHATRDERKD